MLSSRALKNIEQLNRPWRFTPTPDYDPGTNPKGLISFGTAENVRTYYHQANSTLTINQRPMRAEIVNFINDKVN